MTATAQTMQDLVVREPGHLQALPDLALAVQQVEQLIADNASEVLTEARIKAEAHVLYERRKGHRQRENHFATLRLIAEAGLGVLSFEDPSVIRDSALRTHCRTLASAFERGKLLDAIREDGPARATYNISHTFGYTFAPGKRLGLGGNALPWSKARKVAQERGIALEEIPGDTSHVRKRNIAMANRARQQQRMKEAAERLDRMKRQKLIAAAAKEKSPGLDKAYGLLRKTLQALHDAQVGMSRSERDDLSDVFMYLHEAEDALGRLLRVPGSGDH